MSVPSHTGTERVQTLLVDNSVTPRAKKGYTDTDLYLPMGP